MAKKKSGEANKNKDTKPLPEFKPIPKFGPQFGNKGKDVEIKGKDQSFERRPVKIVRHKG